MRIILALTEAQYRATHEAIYQFVENEQDHVETGGETEHLSAATDVLDMFTEVLCRLAEQAPEKAA